MSFPNIPNVNASIEITLEESVNLLLASVAFEELGLAHVINAEAEKIQFVLGTLDHEKEDHECKEHDRPVPPRTIDDLLKIDHAVENMLKTVIKKEMLLQFKLEDTMEILKTKK